MLKNIPDVLSPELLKILMEMGHGDKLLICDGNYPRHGCPDKCVRLDGKGISEILDAILRFFPLDAYVDYPTTLMDVLPGDPYQPVIWKEYEQIGDRYESKGLRAQKINKFDFYEEGRKCYACIATSEKALYANIIIQKGVVVHPDKE